MTFRIALTPGEPAGIGPDLAISLAQQPSREELVAVADPDLLQARAKQLNLPLRLRQQARAEVGVHACACYRCDLMACAWPQQLHRAARQAWSPQSRCCSGRQLCGG